MDGWLLLLLWTNLITGLVAVRVVGSLREVIAGRDRVINDRDRAIADRDSEIQRLAAGSTRQAADQPRFGTFSRDELRSLLSLVHPDRHNGRASANRMSARINQLLSNQQRAHDRPQ